MARKIRATRTKKKKAPARTAADAFDEAYCPVYGSAALRTADAWPEPPWDELTDEAKAYNIRHGLRFPPGEETR